MPWIVGGIDRMLVFCAADRTGSGGLSHEFDACSGGCYHHNAGWSSLVARWAHNPKVGGSNPPPATKSFHNGLRYPVADTDFKFLRHQFHLLDHCAQESFPFRLWSLLQHLFEFPAIAHNRL